MLIRRDYRDYTGGHGKFRDYIAHVDAHPAWSAAVYLTPASARAPGNPFMDVPGRVQRWDPLAADALLLGGMDWAAVPAGDLRETVPVLNLVQHVRHAQAGAPWRGFLARRAIRICVSKAVADAIAATGEVNGPVRVIPAAVDTDLLARIGRAAPVRDVFIDAVKQPALGRLLAAALAPTGLRVVLHDVRRDRPGYLDAMATAEIVVTLPDPAEGLYLPGLEALAMGRALVQYDCVGSREYLHDGVNALVPAREVGAIARAVLALTTDHGLRERLRAEAGATAARFDLVVERAHVHQLLDELDELWTR